MLPNDRVQALPADIGKTIKRIPMNDGIREIHVAPMIIILSADSHIVFIVL